MGAAIVREREKYTCDAEGNGVPMFYFISAFSVCTWQFWWYPPRLLIRKAGQSSPPISTVFASLIWALLCWPRVKAHGQHRRAQIREAKTVDVGCELCPVLRIGSLGGYHQTCQIQTENIVCTTASGFEDRLRIPYGIPSGDPGGSICHTYRPASVRAEIHLRKRRGAQSGFHSRPLQLHERMVETMV